MNLELPDGRRALRYGLLVALGLVVLPFLLVAVGNFVGFYDSYTVLSDSMMPRFGAGDVVFVTNVDPASVSAGDVITYHAPSGPGTVTHEVVEVVRQDGQRLFQTKGINNEEADPYLVPPRAFIGTVLFHVPLLGYAIDFIRSDVGLVLFVVLPLTLLVVTEVIDMRRSASESDDDGDPDSNAEPGLDADPDPDTGGAEGSPGLLERLRDEEYTGENRCVPCTVVNLGIGVVLGTVAGFAAAVGVGSLPVAGVVGAGVSIGAAVVIYFKGYLVPYTPTITKRYFPDRVLRWFDKAPASAAAEGDGGFEPIDVERKLVEMGVVTDCADADDLCLEPSFQMAWRRRIDEVGGDTTREDAIGRLLGVDGNVSVRRYGEASVVHVDGRRAGQWESQAALVADLAADDVLRETDDDWRDLDVVNRSRVLSTLRMFVERCPSCGQPVTIDQETVESCCRTMDVAAVSCDDCGSRVFEIELTDELKGRLQDEPA
jgi:signal peptidase I